MKTLGNLFLLWLVVAIGSCTDDGGIKGSLTLSLTDSPADAGNVAGVNLYISGVDARINGEWKSVVRFQELSGINLLEYTGGQIIGTGR